MPTDYNKQANSWIRNEPIYPSDFIARPVVLNMLKKIGKGKVVLDVGCGEGYFSRKMAKIAKKVIAFDNSAGMIFLAKKQNLVDKYNIDYCVGDMNDMSFIANSSVDICVCNFVINYLHHKKYQNFFRNIERVLRPQGSLVLCGTHPCFYLKNTIGGVMNYKGLRDYDYIKSRGKYFHGTIKTIYGTLLKVGIYHSTLEDYLKAISDAGLKLDKFIEPPTKKSLLAKNYNNLDKLDESPIYMVIQAVK